MAEVNHAEEKVSVSETKPSLLHKVLHSGVHVGGYLVPYWIIVVLVLLVLYLAWEHMCARNVRYVALTNMSMPDDGSIDVPRHASRYLGRLLGGSN